MASRSDGAVAFERAVRWASILEDAELYESEALSHLLWFGPHKARDAEKVLTFLAIPGSALR